MGFLLKQKKEGDKGQFYLEKSGEKVAQANYRMEAGRVVIEYTEVVPAHRGTGAGKELVKEVLGFVKSENLEIESECGYFSHQMKKMR